MGCYLIAVVAFIVSGCAMTPEQANRRSSYALCEILVPGPKFDQEVATQTLASRSYDCRQDPPLIAAKVQAQAVANAAFLQGLLGASAIINASQPQAVQQLNPQTIITEHGYQAPKLSNPSSTKGRNSEYLRDRFSLQISSPSSTRPPCINNFLTALLLEGNPLLCPSLTELAFMS